MRWVYGTVACRDWLPRLGRFGETIRRDGLRQLHSWDAPATPWPVGWLAFCTRVQVSAARDALRYHAVGVWNSRMQRLVATIGTLRRNHPSGRIEAAAQLGRSGDTMACGLACVLHTGAGQCRSGRSAIPCGGCVVFGRVARRSRCGVKRPLWCVRLLRSARVWVPRGSVH